MSGTPNYVEISHQDISQDALLGVIEEFVTREGTDYGSIEYTLDDKMKMILQQLLDKKAKIIFNLEDRTISIVES